MRPTGKLLLPPFGSPEKLVFQDKHAGTSRQNGADFAISKGNAVSAAENEVVIFA